jgi:hypothetical protein
MNNNSQSASTPCASTERCERCGAAFTCGAQLQGCWCSEVKLDAKVLSALKSRYSHCLCRSCLESFAANEAEETQQAVKVRGA